jgi:F-type H+-transporting ATPase subunit a
LGDVKKTEEGDKKTSGHGGEEFKMAEVLEHHLMDGPPIINLGLVIGGKKISVPSKADAPEHAVVHDDGDGTYYYYVGGINMSITRRVLVMIAVALLLIIFLGLGARKITRNPYEITSRFGNFLEVFVQFIRKNIAEPNMGPEGRGFHPYLISLFFFILGCNLIGLLPNVGETAQLVKDLFSDSAGVRHDSPLIKYLPIITPTGDVSVTMTLAIMTFLLIWYSGFRHQGIGFIKNIVPKGVPLPLWVIMWPIELVGPVAKCFALTIRLLANMTAGHVIILALIGMIFQYQNAFIGFGAVPGSVAIYMLEIFVAFLQAYIFTLLTALFVGSAFHRH